MESTHAAVIDQEEPELPEEPDAPELDNGQREMVQAALGGLEATEWEPAAVEATLERLREEHGWGRGKFFSTIRGVVAGRISPPLHDTLALLPKGEAIARLQRALS